jgi:hypothetical protein
MTEILEGSGGGFGGAPVEPPVAAEEEPYGA